MNSVGFEETIHVSLIILRCTENGKERDVVYRVCNNALPF